LSGRDDTFVVLGNAFYFSGIRSEQALLKISDLRFE
jgi:hypothetical protein